MLKLIKVFAIILISLSILVCLFVAYIWTFVINQTTDLVKKNLVETVYIERDKLIFKVKEDHAGSLSIDYNNQTVYHQGLGRKISQLEIENYPSIFEDKKVYHFMLYHYSLGGYQFSGFDFCINQQTVFYGKKLEQCLH